MTRSIVAVAAAGALALAAAGCGSSESSSSSSSAGESGPQGAISMRKLEFEPRNATVRVGEEVTWTNDDDVDHNVTATSGAKFKSRAFGRGKTYTFTPRRPGRIAYVCTLHPGMDATLVVKR